MMARQVLTITSARRRKLRLTIMPPNSARISAPRTPRQCDQDAALGEPRAIEIAAGKHIQIRREKVAHPQDRMRPRIAGIGQGEDTGLRRHRRQIAGQQRTAPLQQEEIRSSGRRHALADHFLASATPLVRYPSLTAAISALANCTIWSRNSSIHDHEDEAGKDGGGQREDGDEDRRDAEAFGMKHPSPHAGCNPCREWCGSARGMAAIHLAAQPAHMGFHDIGAGIEMQVPDIFQQHAAGHDAPGIAHQIFQQLEFLRLQFDALAGAVHLARGSSPFPDRPRATWSPRRWSAAPGHGVDARQQFGEGEGLDQIVVAAAFQPSTRSSMPLMVVRNSTGVWLPLARAAA